MFVSDPSSGPNRNPRGGWAGFCSHIGIPIPFSFAKYRMTGDAGAFGRPSRPPHGAPALDPPAVATIDPHEGAGGSTLRLREEVTIR